MATGADHTQTGAGQYATGVVHAQPARPTILTSSAANGGGIMARGLMYGLVLLIVVGGGSPGVPTETITGQGQSATITREGEFNLTITGNSDVVVVASGTVRRLSATGNGH